MTTTEKCQPDPSPDQGKAPPGFKEGIGDRKMGLSMRGATAGTEDQKRWLSLWEIGPETTMVSMCRPAAAANCDGLSSKVRNRRVPIERANAT